jgi:hypothetical protein
MEVVACVRSSAATCSSGQEPLDASAALARVSERFGDIAIILRPIVLFSERPLGAWCLYRQKMAMNKGPGR